jgi:hypothetical protein
MCAVVERGRSVHRIRRFMRRLIAILLLALVSLQSSWAVAAAYCDHETSRDAAHFGHHADVHLASAMFDHSGDGDTGDADTPTNGHCHDCHTSPVGVILPLVHVAVDLGSGAIASVPPPRLPTPPLQPLDRPDWQTLA